ILDDPNDPLVVVTLTGHSILDALHLSLQEYPKPGKAFLQVSGLRVSFGAAGAGGRRSLTVFLGGERLVAEKEYRVAMSRTMASGAFGYFRLWPQAKQLRPETATVGQALQRALENGPLKTAADGRMVERAVQ